jgi:hypothetical protein
MLGFDCIFDCELRFVSMRKGGRGERNGEGTYGKPLRRIENPRLNISSRRHSIHRSSDSDGFHILAILANTLQQFQSPTSHPHQHSILPLPKYKHKKSNYIPINARLKKILLKILIPLIIQQRRSTMNHIVKIPVLDNLIPSPWSSIVGHNHEIELSSV